MGEVTHELSGALVDMLGVLAPVHEAANGLREQMKRDGYTEAQANETGAVFIAEMIRLMMRGQKP